MNRIYILTTAVVLCASTAFAQQNSEPDPLAVGLGGVATVVGDTRTATHTVVDTPTDSAQVTVEVKPEPKVKVSPEMLRGYQSRNNKLPGDRMETDGEDLLGYAVRR